MNTHKAGSVIPLKKKHKIYEKFKIKSTDNWATPKWLMELFGDWFDPCPLNNNPEVNGLELEWKDKTYINPPYSSPLKWVEKAIEESKKGKTIVMLLKVDTSTKWFAKLYENKAHILFLNGRLKFRNLNGKNDESSPASFPSMLVVLEGKNITLKKPHLNQRRLE